MYPRAVSGPPPQSRTGDDDERLAVLRATLAVAQQRGYHGTTVARVAETARCDVAAVTRLYPDCHDMLRDALRLAFDQWYDEVPTWKPVEPLPRLRDELDRRLRRGAGAGRRVADFWRLGLLLRLEPALADSDCWALFAQVREHTRQALREYWCRILPPEVSADSALVDLAVRGHMSLVDGAVLAAHATPEWELDRMMSFVATGLASAVEREASRQGSVR